jgi:hypothetical protein
MNKRVSLVSYITLTLLLSIRALAATATASLPSSTTTRKGADGYWLRLPAASIRIEDSDDTGLQIRVVSNGKGEVRLYAEASVADASGRECESYAPCDNPTSIAGVVIIGRFVVPTRISASFRIPGPGIYSVIYSIQATNRKGDVVSLQTAPITIEATDANEPNQALVPTTPAVTPAADAPVAPAGVAAHL